MLKEVTVSGSVGKQVVATGGVQQACLKGIILTPSAANATIKVRDGGGAALSGEVVLFARATSANGSRYIPTYHKFTKGMHVEVVGANAAAYLVLE